MIDCGCNTCYCRRGRTIHEIHCFDCINGKHDIHIPTKKEIEAKEQRVKESIAFYENLTQPDILSSCFCDLHIQDCTYCVQHRGHQFKFKSGDIIKQHYMGMDGRFEKNDPYDLFGYELNMYSQKLLRKLI